METQNKVELEVPMAGKSMFKDLPLEEAIARVCHAATREYCLMLGDTSHKPWNESPESLRASVINGVQFYLKNPWAEPKDSHQNWLDFKEKDGWTYGTTKDFEKKTHPCYRPYADLPPEDRMKDFIFLGIVRSMIAGPKPKP